MKTIIFVLVLALCLIGTTSAELIDLGNYVIDFGAYNLPISNQYLSGLRQYMHTDSDPTFTWRWDAKGSWDGAINIFNETIDPTKIHGNLTTHQIELYTDYGVLMGVASAGGMNLTNAYNVSIPLPGLITVITNYPGGKPMTAYVGHIEGPFYLCVMSREKPDMAELILQNLKVIPKRDENAYAARQLASALN
jgi:hypothetical protein